MIKYMFNTTEYQNLVKNITPHDWYCHHKGHVIKPSVIEWINENINGATFCGGGYTVGFTFSMYLIFNFKNEEDAMAFKLRWI